MLCELLLEWGRTHSTPYTLHPTPTFLYNEYGAPYIEGGPHFSISHCKTGIAVAVSENSIGIDIETIRKFKPELMRKTMSPTEQERITLCAKPEEEFIRLWTQKEALVKLQGTGIITDLHHILDDIQDIVWTEIIHPSSNYICTICKSRGEKQ